MTNQSSKGTNFDQYNLFFENILSDMFFIRSIFMIVLKAQQIYIKLDDEGLQKRKLR